MCQYVLYWYDCGCYGALVCDTTCHRIFEELDRINQPDAWEGAGLEGLPFDFPDECAPGWHNTSIMRRLVICDWCWHGGCLASSGISGDVGGTC